MPTWTDLAIFVAATYGCAWTITKSHLFGPIRALAEARRLRSRGNWWVSKLLNCIVCTSAWVGGGLVVLSPSIKLFSDGMHPKGPLDVGVLSAVAIFTTWAIGSKLGDAD